MVLCVCGTVGLSQADVVSKRLHSALEVDNFMRYLNLLTYLLTVRIDLVLAYRLSSTFFLILKIKVSL